MKKDYRMKETCIVKIGKVKIGGNLPILIQSMTDTLTSDIDSTVTQILELEKAGSEIIRLTINNEKSAQCIPLIKKKLLDKKCDIPLVGDFHYNGHILLERFPECAKSIDKYRINPGNIGFGSKEEDNFKKVVLLAIEHKKPIRIGANWGSTNKRLFQRFLNMGLTDRQATTQSLISSVIESAEYAEKLGLRKDQIVLSCKVSEVKHLVEIYEDLYSKCSYPLHVGLTESGTGLNSVVASSIAIGTILQKGIGNTIRVSYTPGQKELRSHEVKVCREILQSLSLRTFAPSLISCPGCGRTNIDVFGRLVQKVKIYIEDKMPIWKKKFPGVENIRIAVMGCVVNGPGESKHSDIGISLSRNRDDKNMSAVVFISGKKKYTLRGNKIEENFFDIIDTYISEKFSSI